MDLTGWGARELRAAAQGERAQDPSSHGPYLTQGWGDDGRAESTELPCQRTALRGEAAWEAAAGCPLILTLVPRLQDSWLGMLWRLPVTQPSRTQFQPGLMHFLHSFTFIREEILASLCPSHLPNQTQTIKTLTSWIEFSGQVLINWIFSWSKPFSLRGIPTLCQVLGLERQGGCGDWPPGGHGLRKRGIKPYIFKGKWELGGLGGRDRCLLGLLWAARDYSTVRESLREEKAFELSLKISTHQFYPSTNGNQQQYHCITGWEPFVRARHLLNLEHLL